MGVLTDLLSATRRPSGKKSAESSTVKQTDKRTLVKRSDIARQYASHPSFADKLPWLEWSDADDMMLLEDGRSVGAVFEVKAIPTEARPEEQVEALHNKLMRLLTKIVPLEDENPWVMQLFVQDDLTLMPIYQALRAYIAKHNSLEDPLAKKYLSIMNDHFGVLCREGGIFQDPMSEIQFRGKIRRVRIVIYRRYDTVPKKNPPDVIEELSSVCQAFVTKIKQMGMRVHRLQAEHAYEWFVRWFNPRPTTGGGTQDALLARYPYPADKKPFGWSFSQNVFFGSVSSDATGWQFDGVKHRVMTFKELDSRVSIGAVSRELDLGDNQKYAVLDKLPAGSIYTLQITFESKAAVKRHLDGIEGAAIGKSGVIKDIHRNVADARYEMDKENLLFRSVEAIYFRGDNDAELNRYEGDIKALLDGVNLQVIDTKNEIYPTDLYLRFLPFNFSYAFDKRQNFRSSYKYADDIARLLPLYGRSQGDGRNPLYINYNRGGEVFMFDNLTRDFKMANSHMAIVGTTGAGKSVTLNNMCLSLSAVRNPRIVAMEVGGSFDLTAKYLGKYGRKVEIMKFDRRTPVAVNPYAEAYKALTIIEAEEAAIQREHQQIQAGNASEVPNEALYAEGVADIIVEKHCEKLQKSLLPIEESITEEVLECNEDRDILNEMVLATRVMITQGNADEEKKIDPTDLALITQALINGMKACKAKGIAQMLLTDVIASMEALADTQNNAQLSGRLKMFALRLKYYTTGIRGQFINRPSAPLDDFDFLHIDFGFMQSETYKDLMNIVCISLLAKVLALAEANKATDRPTELFIDEAHVMFKSDMVAAFVVLMSKVARKIGLWLKPCTQNIKDFTGDEAQKVLSMMETWLCLALEADEVAHVEKFKPLTPEMKAMVLDVRKYPGIYAEGVLLGKRYSGLFRNIPPRIALSLAMTEQHERARRKTLQDTHGISELEAVELMAKEIEQQQTASNDASYFFY